ncbi:PREDICTED: basic leucine zipper and W2 domain-containing protein 1-like [Chinchilla lanigera]|uniref:basic leucine zipper and W2 domain-containing protein 1-like n=1 Tax=Chinchilla lanigera TaxID=34839 RepID=UPI00038EAD16|nr:PREDICTED: basic leucine zipper and W2 domain-containing protein 1-like [Chinchilla lanigera]
MVEQVSLKKNGTQQKPTVRPAFESQSDGKVRVDPSWFEDWITQGLTNTDTGPEAVAQFLDAPGAKLDADTQDYTWTSRRLAQGRARVCADVCACRTRGPRTHASLCSGTTIPRERF